MKTKKIITILALMISLLVGFTNDVNAQTVKQDSVVFYKDTMVFYSDDKKPWGVAIGNFNPDLNDRNYSLSSDTLRIEHNFNRTVTIKSITMYVYNTSYNDIDSIININDKNYYVPKISRTNYSFDIISFKSDRISIRIIGKWFYSMNVRLGNFVVNYEYTDNTSINDVKANTPDIQFINNKFESTTKIDNIKVYDMTGKLIQEGTLNDTYQLDKNTLYFALFDDKFSKKIWKN